MKAIETQGNFVAFGPEGERIAAFALEKDHALFRATPALLDTAVYFNYASNPFNDYEGLDDGAYVTITVTVRAIRDCRRAIKEATP